MATWHAEVESTEWLTPLLVRVVLAGEGLAGFAMPDATDTYVNVEVPGTGARRRYTVRSWDSATGRLTIDVVVHGEAGHGGPWAANARPGDVLPFDGPSGGYTPDPTADWHLMVGDESALPAIAASLEAVPDDRPVLVRLLCDGPVHEIALPTPAGLDLQWLHRRGDDRDVHLLPESVAALALPPGRGHAFVHGEADEIRVIRRHLLSDSTLTRADMSCSPYWRRTMTDEAWRTVKRDFVAAMEADVA